MIVGSAVYAGGRRVEYPEADKSKSGGFTWVWFQDPSEEEFASATGGFDLPLPMVGGAVATHQRARLERYGGTLFVVLKPARYMDEAERVEFGEIHVYLGRDFAITSNHGEASRLDGLRERVEKEPRLLRQGPVAVLHAVLERVVGDYVPVVEGLQSDVEEIESEVFSGNTEVSRRIYELSREVIGFRRATRPLIEAFDLLTADDEHRLSPEMRKHLLGIRSHLLRVAEQTDGVRELLSNILNVNLTLVGVEQNARMQRQNEQVQRISAWAAILIVPTIITGIYGMNFRYMPELSWTLGYPFSLALIVGVSALLYLWFRRSGWL